MPEDVDVNAMMKGKFTLRDMYKQLEALNKMGPLKQIMGMLPLGNMELPEGVYDVTSTKMVRYRIIMDSMTPKELDDPHAHQQFPHAADRPWCRGNTGRSAGTAQILQDDAADPQGSAGCRKRWREVQYAAPDETLLRKAVRNNMTSFAIIGHLARTDGGFSLNDLPGSGGRMDVLCRCVNASLFLSHDLRRDVDCYLVLCGEPAGPKTVKFSGETGPFALPG